MKPGTAKAPPRGREGSVRIIGGRWRGTRLPVPDRPGLRPTSDRARETLFNWLQPMLPGARVLDLFAGSGALGLEALSRGARSAVLVERDRRRCERLRAVADRLDGGGAARIVHADALGFLRAPTGERFDLAFIDPPFDLDLWGAAIATGTGLLAYAKWRAPWALAVAAVLIALPHVVGAPQPSDEATAVPASLAANFAASVLVASAVMWSVLGLAFGWTADWLARRDAVPASRGAHA